MAKNVVSKLFSTGKFQTASTKKFIEANKELFAGKIGKIDFNIEKLLPENSDIEKGYKITKSFYSYVTGASKVKKMNLEDELKQIKKQNEELEEQQKKHNDIIKTLEGLNSQ